MTAKTRASVCGGIAYILFKIIGSSHKNSLLSLSTLQHIYYSTSRNKVTVMSFSVYSQQIKSERTARTLCCSSEVHAEHCEELGIKHKMMSCCLWLHTSKGEPAALAVRQSWASWVEHSWCFHFHILTPWVLNLIAWC